MNRQMIITGVVFVVVAAIAVALMKWVVYVPGVLPKLVIAVIVGLIAAAVAFFVTRKPAPAK